MRPFRRPSSAAVVAAALTVAVLAFAPQPAAASWRARADSLFAEAGDRSERGDHEEAAALYRRVVELVEQAGEPPPAAYFSGLAARSRFLMARSFERLEDWDRATEAYEIALTELADVEDVVRMRLAACYIGSADYEAAKRELRAVIDDSLDTGTDREATLKLAECYERTDDYDRAIQWYRVYLAEASTYNERALAHYRIGLAHEKRGDKETAKRSYSTAVNEFPRSRHAYDALERGRRLSRAFTDRYHQGLVLYNRGRYRDAAEFFLYYMRYDSEGRFDHEAHYFLGRSHQRLGNYGTAARRFKDAIEFGPDAEYYDLAWSKLAYCRRADGHLERSLATYDSYVEKHPEREAAPELLWEKARLLEEKRRWGDAVAAFHELASSYPESPRASDARFRAGLCLYKQDDYLGAESAFADIFLVATGDEAARALFWSGKCRERLGAVEEAEERYRDAVEAARDSYHGARARARLRELAVESCADAADPSGDRVRGTGRPALWGSDALGFASWLAEWYDGVYLPAGRAAIRAGLSEKRSFVRADILLGLGMRDEALAELSRLAAEVGDDPRALDVLIDYCERSGLYKRAIQLAEWILEISPAESISDAPVYLRKRICPTHFSDIVLRECAARGIDPMIEFALIRQESLFEPHAVSWVGARGLSQIMPSTGRWVAKRLGVRRFRTAQLFDAETNIRFGTEYLAAQLEEFDGDVLRALAAYNGGPEASERWWSYGGAKDSDIFAEDIGYSQTIDYVRRIFLYSEIYRDTYGG